MEDIRVPESADNERCPRCGRADARPARRAGFIALLFEILGRVPFRCRNCRRRFFRPEILPREMV